MRSGRAPPGRARLSSPALLSLALLPSGVAGVAPRAGSVAGSAAAPPDLAAAFVVPAASAVAIATLGLVALLFWGRDRGRSDLLVYALLSAGLGTYLVAGRAGTDVPGRRLVAALSLALPPLAYLLLLRFL